MVTQLQQHFRGVDLTALTRKASTVVTVLLIVLIAWVATQLVWLLLTPAQSPLPMTTPAQQPRLAASNNTARSATSDEIVSRHLFGEAKETEAKVVEAPETRLNLKLRGVYATDDEHKGYALIASGSGAEKLYATGKSVPGNAVLKAVYPDRVILDRKGRYETLRMVDTKASGGSTYVPRNSGRSAQTRKLGRNSRAVKLREEILRNPRKLAELVSAQPAYENGVFAGYRITTRRADPVFKELNLKSGDIITQVNGIQIDSPQKGLQILQQLARASEASVTIKRNGQYIELNLSL
jgi:general secretion pathway protein C